MCIYIYIVVDLMELGNIVPRVGTEATPLAFRASMLTIKPTRLPDVTTIPTPTCLVPTYQQGVACTRSWSRQSVWRVCWKCRNDVSRARFEPTSLAFQAGVLTIPPLKWPGNQCHVYVENGEVVYRERNSKSHLLPSVLTILPLRFPYFTTMLTCLCGSLTERSV